MLIDPNRKYDVIGDIHGCVKVLERLLSGLGYRRQNGVWRHRERQALFLGDLVDRGPHIREVVHLVRDMMDAGQAQCLMGNHEWYALVWDEPMANGQGTVRQHSENNLRLIRETLDQFANYPADWQDFRAWVREMPFMLDAGRFRLVHACWDDDLIRGLRSSYPNGVIDSAFIQQSAEQSSFASQCIQRLLRGIDMPLPDGLTMTSRDGYVRSVFRTKFWEESPQTYGDIVFQPDRLPDEVANLPLTNQQKADMLHYGLDQPMLFVGHYWCRGNPAPLRPNLACLDYSAVRCGKLVAYRLDEETELDPRKFFWVEVKRPELDQ